jgi:hypothetical protein
MGVAGDPGKIAVFKVSRVWKGDVGPIFEMPAREETGGCLGFWPRLLKVGNDLVVFAYRWPGATAGASAFDTTICSRTDLAKGNEDLSALGAGYEPDNSPEANRRKVFYRYALTIVVSGSLISYLIRRRISRAHDFSGLADYNAL